jgi:uncharacterized protein (TIGR02145 family)
MYKNKIHLRNVIAIAICLAVTTMFSSCGYDSPSIKIIPPATTVLTCDVRSITLEAEGTHIAGGMGEGAFTWTNDVNSVSVYGKSMNVTLPGTYTVTGSGYKGETVTAKITITQNAVGSCSEDAGVVINGVRWATRNVDTPGTFATHIYAAGKYYQWGRNIMWTDINNWNHPIADLVWARQNDPCPKGWRVPTREEFVSLLATPNIWHTIPIDGDINGRLFGSGENALFLPATGQQMNGGVRDLNLQGHYWSGTLDAQSGNKPWTLCVIHNQNYFGMVNHLDKTNGYSIRCVAE